MASTIRAAGFVDCFMVFSVPIRSGMVLFTLSLELADYFNVFNFFFTTINFVLILKSFLKENLRSFTRVDFPIIRQSE